MFVLRGFLVLGAVLGLTALAATALAKAGPKAGAGHNGAPAGKAIRARPGQGVHNHRGAQHRHFVEGVVVNVHNGRGGKAGPGLTIRVGDQHHHLAGLAGRRRLHDRRDHETFRVDGNTRFQRLANAGTAGQSEGRMLFHQLREGDLVKILRGQGGLDLALQVDVLEGGRHRHHRHHHRGGGGGAGGAGGAGGNGGNGGFANGGFGNGVNVGVNADLGRRRGGRHRGFNENINVNVDVNGRGLRKVPLRHALLSARRMERRVERREDRREARRMDRRQDRRHLGRAVARHSLISAGRAARVAGNHARSHLKRLVDRRQDRKAAGLPVAHPLKGIEKAVKGTARNGAAKSGSHSAGHGTPHSASHSGTTHARHASTAHAGGHRKR
jgi:hypothetical protein